MLLRLCLLRFMSPRHKSLSPAEITLQHRCTAVICEAWMWRVRETILKICFVDHMNVRECTTIASQGVFDMKCKRNQSVVLATQLCANVRVSVAIIPSFAMTPPLCRAHKSLTWLVITPQYGSVATASVISSLRSASFFILPSLFLLFLLLLYSKA